MGSTQNSELNTQNAKGCGLPENVIAIANFQHFERGRGIKTNDLVPLFDWLLNCSSTGAQGRGSQAGSRHHYGSPARLLLGNGVRVEQDVPLASLQPSFSPAIAPRLDRCRLGPD